MGVPELMIIFVLLLPICVIALIIWAVTKSRSKPTGSAGSADAEG